MKDFVTATTSFGRDRPWGESWQRVVRLRRELTGEIAADVTAQDRLRHLLFEAGSFVDAFDGDSLPDVAEAAKCDARQHPWEPLWFAVHAGHSIRHHRKDKAKPEVRIASIGGGAEWCGTIETSFKGK